GGLLGILMMIPLRRAFIVHLHGKPGEPGKLLYPEGTACAQVLISGDKGGASGQMVFIGFGLAFVHKFLTEGMNLLTTTVALPLRFGDPTKDPFSRIAKFTSDMASELLGVGYIIGVRTAAIMMAGAVLGGLVIAPTVALTGDPSWDLEYIYKNYLRYIGAGCVAAAGIISMARTLPMIVRSFSSGFGTMRGDKVVDESHKSRTEDDLPPSVVFGGSIALLIALACFLMQEVAVVNAFIGAGLVLLFGFLFVTVSSRLTGEIGSSSNPISGMTVATLLMTCLIFLAMGLTSPTDAVLALSIGGVVCIAASNGGTTSQDLKTGYLLGATPRLQQWSILVGAITSAIVIGGTLLLFNQVGTVYSLRNLPDVNVKDRIAEMKETEFVPDDRVGYEVRIPADSDPAPKPFRVWRPNKAIELPSVSDPKVMVKIRPGKYLVDDAGNVRFFVDPTITGDLKKRDHFKSMMYKGTPPHPTKEAIAKIKDTVRLPNRSGNGYVDLRVWNNTEEPVDKEQKFDPAWGEGEYLLDETGYPRYENEPTMVPMKFQAPKTQVMGIIINGLLGRNLNWTLILIGAFIAVALELCAVSSLAFAVGLYIPMQYSTPIFLGGLVRWAVDGWIARRSHAQITATSTAEERAEAEVRAIAESESSPAMLLSSGFIAGGSLGGVLIAFLNFLPDTAQKLYNFGPMVDRIFGGAEDNPSIPQELIALVIFLGLAAVLLLTGFGKPVEPPTRLDEMPPVGEGPDTRFRVDE
ncbi:MAG TPA: OPT/YSL family transporter, partial [Gemmataceae bacterium]|nr:OPT/YSL family transporter [Gemmataceae bacterium]